MKQLLLIGVLLASTRICFGQDASQMPNRCTATGTINTSGPVWNGWGAALSNTRFQSERIQPPQLKLRWAFGFPGAKAVSGQPSIVGGRVFVSADNGYLYSLDASTGCVYWSFHAEATIRSSATVERISADRYAAFFGDAKANAYAVDVSTGALIWKVRVDDHPLARITGAPKLFENRIYVPVASGEEGAGGNS